MRFPRHSILSLPLIAASTCLAQIPTSPIITFEGLPSGTVLTNQYALAAYSNAMFLNASVLSAGISLNEFEAPPHSGSNVATDTGGPLTVAFGTPVSSISGSFTHRTPLTLQAFDEQNNLLGTVTSQFSSNLILSGIPGSSPNELLVITAPSSNLSKVTITGDPAGNSFTLDDLTIAMATACSFTLGSPGASLTQIGTASAGGVLPEASLAVSILPTAGAGCTTTYTLASSASWLTATVGATGFSYTALTNPHPSSRSAALTVTNAAGGSATFTVTEAGNSEPLLNRQVRALYQSVLGRDPDPSGFAFWTGSGSAGLGQMLDSFLTSPEAFNSDFAVMATYESATGGTPTYAQFTAAVARVRAGMTINSLFNSLISTNYTGQNLYQNLLQRVPLSSETNNANAVGLPAWFQTLVSYPSNTTPVTAPDNEFMSTGTFANGADHTNGLYIAMLYYVILGRDLDQTGYNFWLGIANAGHPGILFTGPAGYATRIQILGPGTPNQGFAGSPEFQGLFQ